jgi:hypothetical protein
MVQFELLYNQQTSVADFSSYYNRPLSVKTLSFTEYNLFAGISYPISPLLTLSLSGIYYPKLSGFYVGPSFCYSLANNLDFNFIFQTFKIKNISNPFSPSNKLNLNFAFLQLKYNF